MTTNQSLSNVLLLGVAGAVDWERWSDTGRERPVLHAAADP